MAGYEKETSDMRSSYKVPVRTPDGKEPLVRPGRRWEDIINTDHEERVREV
jgi:hypothetical protein